MWHAEKGLFSPWATRFHSHTRAKQWLMQDTRPHTFTLAQSIRLPEFASPCKALYSGNRQILPRDVIS